MAEPLKATRFGYPYDKIPTSFDVYFKYKRGTYAHTGEVFTTREGTPDFCAIYADFFDNVIAKEENPLNIPTLIDPERLKKQEYSLAIVCCSSYYGDFFEGAIDSELTIDDFTIHYEDVPVQP